MTTARKIKPTHNPTPVQSGEAATYEDARAQINLAMHIG